MRSLDIVWQFLGNPDRATRDALEFGAVLIGAGASIATFTAAIYKLSRWVIRVVRGKKPTLGPRDRDLVLRLRRAGWGKYRAQEYGPAIVAFDEAIRLHGNSANAYHGRGMCRLQRGEFHKAIADFNNFAAITPLATAAFYNRAIAYERLGARAEALKDFDRVLLLRPHHQDALAGKARLLRNAVRSNRPPASNSSVIGTRESALAAAAIVLLLMGALVVGGLLLIA